MEKINICYRCNIEKNVNEFVKNTNLCKPCQTVYNREYRKKQKEKSVDINMFKICKKCNENKSYTDYTIGKNICKKCINIQALDRINNNNLAYFGQLVDKAKGRAKTRLKKNRVSAGEFDITSKDLYELYENQKYCCYYSGITLSLRRNSNWQCSLERLNPELGYIKKNIALICLEFQSQVQWTKLKYNVFKELIQNYKKNCTYVIESETTTNETVSKNTDKSSVLDNNTSYRCIKCNEYKNASEFIKQLSRGCKKCRSLYHNTYKSTLNGFMRLMLRDIRSTCKHKKYLEPKITHQNLIDLIKKQKYKCAYSGIIMTIGSYKKSWWTCSIERININKEYSLDNVCFVCLEFNTADHSNLCLEKKNISGFSGWSKEKIDLIKQHILDEIIEDIRTIL